MDGHIGSVQTYVGHIGRRSLVSQPTNPIRKMLSSHFLALMDQHYIFGPTITELQNLCFFYQWSGVSLWSVNFWEVVQIKFHKLRASRSRFMLRCLYLQQGQIYRLRSNPDQLVREPQIVCYTRQDSFISSGQCGQFQIFFFFSVAAMETEAERPV